jgi:hypothetical protein
MFFLVLICCLTVHISRVPDRATDVELHVRDLDVEKFFDQTPPLGARQNEMKSLQKKFDADLDKVLLQLRMSEAKTMRTLRRPRPLPLLPLKAR